MRRTINITLVEEEKPFLVAGYSVLAKAMVFGFPYFHKKKVGSDKSEVCPCIILPVADDGKLLPHESEYDFAVKRGEFHPVKGKLHKFVREQDGMYVFEDGVSFLV